MGKLLNYLGESKILKRIADVLNVKDVKVNGVSVVDNNGDAIIPATTQVQSDWAQTDNTQPDYIKNKPSTPSGQVQSDWNQTDTSEPDFIKNKPTLADVATSGDYEDLTNTPDIPTISDTYDGTSQDGMSGIAVKSAIDALPEPMVFKGSLGTGGTITALPVDGSASRGDTYKVITAGTYAGQPAKIGDTFICDSKTSSANTWTYIPSGDEPSGTVTSVTIKATSPIVSSSSSAITTSGTRTISHATSGATAGSYGDSSAQTPAYGATFKVPYVTVNDTGHVTSISEHTVKIPASDNTDTKVTSADNHYPPATVSGEEKTASASGASAAWSIDVVKGLTISTDGKGHITDLAVTSGKIPANPSKNSTITIQKNGTDVDSFTLNQSTDKPINITMSKSDVGLNNVPNVTTNNQTPSFNQASTRANIVSGEKLSVILGKIMKWYADLKTVAFTGSYDDLSDKPTIPSAQVNSDWDASSGVAKILNKPTLATVATSGSYNDLSNKPTIPTVNNGTLTITQNGTSAGTFSANQSGDNTIPLTDENVKQTKLTTANSWRRVLLSGTNNDNDSIGYAYKNTALIFQNTTIGTTSVIGESKLRIGNTTKSGSDNNQFGKLEICDTQNRVVALKTVDSIGSASVTQTLQGKDGTIALTDDIKTYTGTGLISVNSSTNEISTTAEENQNAFSTVVMDDGAVAINMNASSKQDSITFKAGTAIVLSGTTLNKTITIDSSDQNVKQTDLSTSTTGNYRVLLSSDTSNSERTANVYKNRRLLFYPSTSTLSIIGASYRSQVTPNYVYVGNTSAMTGARLYASGDQDFWLQSSNEASTGVKIGVYETTPAWAFAPMSNNTMRLGSPSLKWSVVYATNSTINTSDRNEKENIVDLDSEFAKDFIMDLKPVSFKRIDGDRTHYGLIAQDVEETLDKFDLTSMDFGGLCKDQKVEQIYTEDEEGNPHYEQKEVNGEFTYGLRYEEFIAPLIKTVQLQQQEIELLKQEIELLKQK